MEDFWAFMTVLTICVTICAMRGLRLKYRRDDKKSEPDVREMQEMNRGLQRMEDRIEALETLLMDRPKASSTREWE